MRTGRPHRVPASLAVLLLAAGNGGAVARSLSLEAARLDDPRATATRLRIELHERDGASSLHLSAARLEVPLLRLAGELDWQCALRRTPDGARACSGPLRLGAEAAELDVRIGGTDAAIELRRGAVQVSLALPFADAPSAVDVRQLPAAWLKPALDAWWPAGELREGIVDAHAEWLAQGSIEARFSVDGLALNTRDGTVSTEGVDVSGELHARPLEGGWQVDADTRLHDGVLGVGTLRVALPSSPVDAAVNLTLHDDGRLDVTRLAWRDAGTLELEAAFELQPADLAPLRRLHAKVVSATMPQALTRYASGLLEQQGLAGLALKGELGAELDVGAEGAIEKLAFHTDRLDLHEAASGIAFEGLHGGLDWAVTGERPATALGWKVGRIGEVAVPATSARWQSRAGALHLVGELRAPMLGGELRLSNTMLAPFAQAPDAERVVSDFALKDIGYDSADGTLAAAGLAAEGRLQLSGSPDRPRLRANARLQGGEVLAGALYMKLPQAAVDAELDASIDGASWRIHRIGWRDPGTLAFEGSAEIVPDDEKPLRALRLDLREAELATAVDRYARSWLATNGQAGLVAQGSLTGRIAFDADGLQQLAFDAKGLGVAAADDAFAFSGVDGGIDWEGESDRPPTALAWRSGALFGIPFGGAGARLQSRGGTITLAQPIAVGVLGGEIKLERLTLQPRSPRGERYAASVSLGGIEMSQLSAAFGWPAFPGKLSGGIPEVEFSGDVVALHGGLDLYVFDGHLGLNSLVLERPFGVAPSLGANIHFENLDLQQVTSAFSFGGMSGRLFGTINELRLVDWSPVAFDAWLRTRGGGRMSYNAVNDLTSIGGGGGMSASLQTMALKIFDTFGYRQLGLRCRLREQVCMMAGVDPPAETDSATAGYTIVEGSGVPRITIVGHRRRVDWPTLVSRLQEATQGQGPVVE